MKSVEQKQQFFFSISCVMSGLCENFYNTQILFFNKRDGSVLEPQVEGGGYDLSI